MQCYTYTSCLTSLKMQKIRSLPRKCYSSCRGTISKLKTRKYEQRISSVFLVVICLCSLLILREMILEADNLATYRCYSVCDREVQNNNSSCRRLCVLELPEERATRKESFQDFHSVAPSSLYLRIILSIVGIIFVFGHNIKNTMKKQICLASHQKVTWQTVLFRQLPLKTVTKLIGKIAACRFPYPLNEVAVRNFAWLMSVNIKEAHNDNLSSYKSVLQLFTRTLKPGLRPVNTDYEMVSPADSKVIYVGGVANGVVEQVKGVSYSLKTFAGRGVLPQCKEGHSLFNAVFYLSPGDYHHFHSPVNWNADLCRHFKGDLLTVNPLVLKCVPGLFALNERVWLSGQWEHGFFSLTAVGALNVGSIHVKVCEDLNTNDRSQNFRYTPYTDRRLLPTQQLSKGEYLGGFDMGSTIVLVFEAPNDFRFAISPGDIVKYGQALGRLM